MITLRDATPQERALILRQTGIVAVEIPAAWHLKPARVAELLGMPREEFLRGPVLADLDAEATARRRSVFEAPSYIGWPTEDPHPVDVDNIRVRIIEALDGEMTSRAIAAALDVPLPLVWAALGDLVRSRAVRKITRPDGNQFRLEDVAP